MGDPAGFFSTPYDGDTPTDQADQLPPMSSLFELALPDSLCGVPRQKENPATPESDGA